MERYDGRIGNLFAGIRRETNFYVIRHGESTANAEGRIQGLREYPLSERGRLQAVACGRWFSGTPVLLVFSSPLARALETASLVAREAGFPEPESLALYREIDTGCFSGLTLGEAKAAHPESYVNFEAESWEGVPGAESREAICERAIRAWETLAMAAGVCGGDVALVTHGGFIQWMYRVTFGCVEWMPLISTGNCGIFHLLVSSAEPGRSRYMHWREVNKIADPLIGSTPQVF